MRYFDDIAVGDRMALGAVTFTAEAIKAFAAQYDPQVFHMDEAAAAKSHFGALCASGWHTVAAWMNLRVQYGRREDEERAARGEPLAKLGPSPGFRELKWLRPVYVGDVITYASEVVEKRRDQEPPGLGHRLRAQHRDQSERRTGHVLHRLGIRRAKAGRRMTAAAETASPENTRQRRAARDGRCGRRACAARRLHRSDFRDAADLAGRIRPELCGGRSCCAACSPAPWRDSRSRPAC